MSLNSSQGFFSLGVTFFNMNIEVSPVPIRNMKKYLELEGIDLDDED